MELASADLRKAMLKYRRMMVTRQWIGSKIGGIAVKEIENILYIPTSSVAKIIGDDDLIKSIELNRHSRDDLNAALWVKGFSVKNVRAMAYITSVNSIVVMKRFEQKFQFETTNPVWKQLMPDNFQNVTFSLPIIANLNEWFDAIEHDPPPRPSSSGPIKGKSTEVFPPSAEPTQLESMPSSAVLLLDRGLFVWGSSIDNMIQKCEAIEKMFETAVFMNLELRADH